MRTIIKQIEPVAYNLWRKAQKRSPDYSSIPQELKETLKKSMIHEQKGLCCYCCGKITYTVSHIEHLYPRNLCKVNHRKKLTDYNNMLASCNGTIKDFSEDTDEFCGHRKKNWYEEKLMISPLEKDCEDYFTYTAQGMIKARAGNDRARETINRLGLDEYALNEARRAALVAIGYFEPDFDREAAKTLLIEDENGCLLSFINIIEYFLNK